MRPIYYTLTSRVIAVAALSAATLSTAQTASEPAPAPLIMQTRNVPNLNARNLGERTYVLPSPSADATQFRFKLKGYVFGLRMIKANYVGYVDGGDYAAYTDLKTSGLGALLKKLEIWAVSRGEISADGLRPRFHVQQNMDGKERRVEMNYDNAAQAVDVNIVPALGSQGVPPASPAERYSADDTVSAVLAMMFSGYRLDAPLCDGTLRVFDSKQHYGLRMVRDGAGRKRFNGDKVDTVKCKVFYEPINGFDPEDLPSSEEGSTPITVHFVPRPDLGLNIPVQFTYKISAIKAKIKLGAWQVITPKAVRAQDVASPAPE